MTPRRTTPPRRARGRLTIREVRDPRDPAIRQAYALLARTFPRGERVDLREWTGTLRERALGLLTDLHWHLVVAERGGRVVGIASGNYLGSLNLGVIGYLAIADDVRGHGAGTRLRERLRRAFAADARHVTGRPLAAIVGEVSARNPWLRHLAARRDVLVLDFRYYQPRLRDGDAATPFRFYYQALTRHRARLPTAELRRILYAIWRRVYRIQRPLDQPAFRAMLRSLARRAAVGAATLPPPRPR